MHCITDRIAHDAIEKKSTKTVLIMNTYVTSVKKNLLKFVPFTSFSIVIFLNIHYIGHLFMVDFKFVLLFYTNDNPPTLRLYRSL